MGCAVLNGRLIPVLTGNSHVLNQCALALAVNPRAYGEQSTVLSDIFGSDG